MLGVRFTMGGGILSFTPVQNQKQEEPRTLHLLGFFFRGGVLNHTGRLIRAQRQLIPSPPLGNRESLLRSIPKDHVQH